MRQSTRLGRSGCVATVRRKCLPLGLLAGLVILPGPLANSVPVRKAAETTIQTSVEVPEPAVSLPQPPAGERGSSHPAEKPTGKSQPFRFTKVDLELLRRTDAFDKYIEERGWVYSDPETNDYLEKLGLSLVPTETPENVKWRFRTIRDLEVNAFALPNGSIYVNSGLLARMENEAQLAGALAHEVAHVVGRHGYLQCRSSRKKMVSIDVILAAVSPAITIAMGNLLPMIVTETMFGYSPELEHEADVYAVHALYSRGYDLREFSRGFELLRKGPEVDLSTEPVFWASHPKLASREQYITDLAKLLQSNDTGFLVNQHGYRSATVNVIRHNAELAILLGRPRTAVAIAQRLIADEPNNAENYVLLGDAYRSLGARTPLPQSDETTNEAKNATRQRLHKMTIAEYDNALLADPQGAERWQANTDRSEEAFRKALQMDPRNATAHRGLGFLFELNDARQDAIAQFQKYLEMTPNAKDARQVRLHLDSLLKASPGLHPQAAESQNDDERSRRVQ